MLLALRHYLLNALSMHILFLIATVISIVMKPIMTLKCYHKHYIYIKNQIRFPITLFKPAEISFTYPCLLKFAAKQLDHSQRISFVFPNTSELELGSVIFNSHPSQRTAFQFITYGKALSASETLYRLYSFNMCLESSI